MGGIPSTNIWTILLLTVLKVPQSYALPFSELTDTVNVQLTSLTAEVVAEEVSMLENFFVASAKNLDPEMTTTVSKTTPSSSTTTDCAFTAKDKDTLPVSVPTKHVPSVVPSQHQPLLQALHPCLNEKVEYDIEFDSYEYTNGIKTVTVKNRLKDHVQFWEDSLKPSELVLSTVKFGYVIPFIQEPPSVYLNNNRSAFNNSSFVLKAITELKLNGCITEVSNKPYVINPLTVAISDSKKERLVLDLRHVNKYVQKQKIKFEGVKEAKQYAKKGFFMLKFDLRHGYHHINIHPEHQKFLGFSWVIDGQERYFIFSVLPFGLSSAGHIFTKVVRTLVNFWRSQSFPIIVYLDDGWACDSRERCVRMSKSVLHTLLKSGFLPNFEKSIFFTSAKIRLVRFFMESGIWCH
ncbi:Hypothetical predicted protein [Mytilus galloprovincialis]|uniref:Reverse transcriptase domain-containing protein n=1 Tax=Mytilus galloprovincialis TaxID=29158 RepID=A0A8B6FEW0_MYTGA|nr:Hypothetical predicted protein [Mytilus galloprovincialis]